ncbi:MAG TPA: XRE family transcriptional regulator [Chitinophagales bacterium]|nr:XRE family transcriptional regulator [Chitinophagales bacterium]
MNLSDKNTFANRLRLARKLAGMSLQELSDALTNAVTKQSLHKYETGLMKPTSDVLLELSKTLNVKPDYFLRPTKTELGEVLFRKRQSLSKKSEESIVERARDYVERYLELENILSAHTSFKNSLESFVIKNKADAEQAANQLREDWELGTSPIQNVVEVLELRGIKVLLIESVEEIDGLATLTSEGIPLIVVNTKNRSVERIRFTIIHELAHLLLRFHDSIKNNGKEIEILCHCFSSCFLIPSKMLLKLIGSLTRSYIAIAELISIKEYYGISIRALIHRLKELQVITPNYYQRWVIYLSKKYGQKNEPGEYRGEEKSKIFEQLINRALSEELISVSKAAVLCNTSISQLRKGIVSVN